MPYRIAGILLVLVLVPGSSLTAAEKPRVIVLTDIENEPDDAESIIRFLVREDPQPRAWFTVPTQRVMPPGAGTMHIILAVPNHHGTPRLTGYGRVVATVRAAAPSVATTAAPARQIAWSSEVLHQASEWYASADARAIADSVLQYQSPQGGWPKSIDLAIPPRSPEDVPQPGDGRANTIDNGATTTPMRFLALVADATGQAKYRKAFERGMDYLLAAQYPNGGWPQFYPLREGYYSRITFNDNAMINVLTLLRDVGRGDAPYGFVDRSRRQQASAAAARGIDVILRSQIRQDGRLTAWCAQHDEKTLEPAWARAYEPPSLSGGETVGIVRFLMSLEEPTPEIIASIEGAVLWLRSVAISGIRVERISRPDGRTERNLVESPYSPPVWARFYELGTNRPLYLDRDSVYRYDFSEISYERRSGYSYHGDWASSLLSEDYPRWRAENGLQ